MIGLWWLPNPSDEASNYQLPKHRVSGRLHGEGPWELTTIGSVLSDDPMHPFVALGTATPPRQDAIWGTDSEGNSLSLFDVWRAGGSWQSNSPLGGNEKWHVGWYTSGNVWVEQHEVVSHVTIRFDALDDWASSRILATHDFAFEDGSLRLPEPASYKATTGDTTVTLRFGSDLSPAAAGYHVSRFSSFDIEGENLRLDEVVQNWVRPLMVLLDLLTTTPVRVTGVTVLLENESPEIRLLMLELHPNLIQPKEERDTSRGQLDMPATRAALGKRGLGFGKLIPKYFALNANRRHRRALGLLSHSQARILDTSTDSEFLTAFKAIELYHQAEIRGTDLPPGEHKARVEAVVEGAPEEWRAWARGILQDRNAKGARTLLREVMDRASTTGESIEEAWPAFCREAVKYRNRAAHGRTAVIGSLGLRYHAAALGLHWLLRHVYLLELGLLEADTSDLIQNDEVFKREMRLLKEWYGKVNA